MKDQYLTADSIKSYAIQFKAIVGMKDKKDSPSGLPKLSKSTDPLAWMDRCEKTLWMLIGQDYTPLAYLIREVAAVPVTTDDLIVSKCYSTTNKSFFEDLVAQKFHDSACVEVDKILLFNNLDKALQNRPLELAIQAHKDTNDGQAVIKITMVQHSREGMWEKLHEKLIHSLKTKWKSTGNITLIEHIAKFCGNIAKIVLVCKHTDHTAPTEREQVLQILASIETTDTLLQAHVSNINGHPVVRGSNFKEIASHLMLVDPVEQQHTNQSGRKFSYSYVLGTYGIRTLRPDCL